MTRENCVSAAISGGRESDQGIASGNFMSCIGDFIHRDIYTTIDLVRIPKIIGGEDWDFWLRVLAIYSWAG